MDKLLDTIAAVAAFNTNKIELWKSGTAAELSSEQFWCVWLIIHKYDAMTC